MCVCVLARDEEERNWAWAYLKMRPLPIVSWLLDLLGRAPHQNRVGCPGATVSPLCELIDSFPRNSSSHDRTSSVYSPVFLFYFFFRIFKIPAEITPSQKNRSAITTTTGLRPFIHRYSYTFLFTFGHANPERLWPGLPWLFARLYRSWCVPHLSLTASQHAPHLSFFLLLFFEKFLWRLFFVCGIFISIKEVFNLKWNSSTPPQPQQLTFDIEKLPSNYIGGGVLSIVRHRFICLAVKVLGDDD